MQFNLLWGFPISFFFDCFWGERDSWYLRLFSKLNKSSNHLPFRFFWKKFGAIFIHLDGSYFQGRKVCRKLMRQTGQTDDWIIYLASYWDQAWHWLWFHGRIKPYVSRDSVGRRSVFQVRREKFMRLRKSTCTYCGVALFVCLAYVGEFWNECFYWA